MDSINTSTPSFHGLPVAAGGGERKGMGGIWTPGILGMPEGIEGIVGIWTEGRGGSAVGIAGIAGIAGIGGVASLGNVITGIGGRVGIGSEGIVGNGGNVGFGSVGIVGIVGVAGDAGVSKRWRAAVLESMLSEATSNEIRNQQVEEEEEAMFSV
ncbi:uncharacterized protein A4U43_C08F23270 [Asparagus officinalis]|nr:uncharacterized protein A4U43_C08F23270 [Asparagus officinalis]